ncbi:ParA family protein [Fangia hongkongensis]|uniref:ParA family protein n=2 Tax=Fangia hongkongensis TaxID=270495 RepID=UPI000375A7B2|nr:AAA family ATPase [Fangia hongkongensis]
MSKIISLFNHKGGVSKTTTTFNLGWSLANCGFKTLIVDADPQCNLTAYVLGLQDNNEFDTFYNSKHNDDIYAAIEPIISGSTVDTRSIKPAKTLHDNLFLAAGNIAMAELDVSLSIGLAGGRFVQFAQQFVGAFYATINETCRVHEFDVVLIDMSPSASALNRCILMSSDYFIVPTSPDFFCYQAVQSLSKMLPQWNDDFKPFRLTTVKNSLSKTPPKMLGIISQRYRPHKTTNKDKAKSFQVWVDRIQHASKNILANELAKCDMVINEEDFRKYQKDESPFNLISIPDFNSLIAKAQENRKPVFTLTQEELNQSGVVYEKSKENQEKFEKLFSNLAEIVSKLCKLSK